MKKELNISVLYGDGLQHSEIEKTLESIPHLKLLSQVCDPGEFWQANDGHPLDAVLVYLNGDNEVPEWLESLARTAGQTAVLLCSASQEPGLLIRAMQAGVREFLPLPLQPKDLEASLERVTASRDCLKCDLDQHGRVVAVTGHKGGAGVSTVAVHLALALAEQTSEPVALVDLGRPFPDVANLLNLEVGYSIADLVQNISRLDQFFLQKIMHSYEGKVAILHGCPDFREHDAIELEAMVKVFAVLRTMYRYIVVDLSHWLDDLFLQVLAEADEVLMLTKLDVQDLRNLKKLWPMLLEWNLDQNKIGIVVNHYDKGSVLQMRDLELVCKKQPLVALPSDPQGVGKAASHGEPLSTAAPGSKLWHSLKDLAGLVRQHNPGETQESEAPVQMERSNRRPKMMAAAGVAIALIITTGLGMLISKVLWSGNTSMAAPVISAPSQTQNAQVKPAVKDSTVSSGAEDKGRAGQAAVAVEKPAPPKDAQDQQVVAPTQHQQVVAPPAVKPDEPPSAKAQDQYDRLAMAAPKPDLKDSEKQQPEGAQTTAPAPNQAAVETQDQSGQKAPALFVASPGGKAYHAPDCSWVKNVPSERLRKFSSPEEAQAAGYHPCRRCQGHKD